MSDLTENSEDPTLTKQLEALLFVASGPVTVGQLATALEIDTEAVDRGLRDLEQSLSNQGRGLQLQWHASRVQLTTVPDVAGEIERFLGLETTARLSRAALETLAIIAYQQPVTRPQVDAIRGVNSDGVLKSLLGKGLIQEEGRAEAPGRPILFGTTADFLQYFGLASIQELPTLEKIEGAPEKEKTSRKILKD
ncbi:MAG TPA: SMC-Scp complex subunit ScpB [Anaerolineaceae bacterium]|nr:SMC-Scp complex subunit ScpB [Anaerolineaceae bacterium]